MVTPERRLTRMRESFDKDKSMLAEDYVYFTTPRVPIRQSKVERKSAERREKQSRGQNGTQSSDKTGG